MIDGPKGDPNVAPAVGSGRLSQLHALMSQLGP